MKNLKLWQKAGLVAAIVGGLTLSGLTPNYSSKGLESKLPSIAMSTAEAGLKDKIKDKIHKEIDKVQEKVLSHFKLCYDLSEDFTFLRQVQNYEVYTHKTDPSIFMGKISGKSAAYWVKVKDDKSIILAAGMFNYPSDVTCKGELSSVKTAVYTSRENKKMWILQDLTKAEEGTGTYEFLNTCRDTWMKKSK